MANVKDLRPKVQAMLGLLIKEVKDKLKYDIICTQGYRSIAEQNAIYAQGRTKPGKIVTNARGGSSFHNFGVAFDICFVLNKKAFYPPASDRRWKEVADIAIKLGLEWGDRGYKDIPHFQYRAGYSLTDFQRNRIDPKKFLR